MNSQPTSLDEERVARMRDQVMTAVDADMTRRGRRGRRIVGGSLAALVVVAAVGIGQVAIRTDDSAEIAVAPSIASLDSGAVDQQMGGAAMDGSSMMSLPAPEAASAVRDSTAAGGTAYADKDAQVITTGWAEVKVSSPARAAEEFATWVTAHQGRIGNRSESEQEDGKHADLTVHVPDLDAAVEFLRGQGEILTLSVSNDDVTMQSEDLDARIAALETSIDRLTQLMAQATTSEDLIQAEQALTDRQAQLESYQSQRAYLDDQITLDTLTVSFHEGPSANSPSPDGFWGGIVTGWNGLVGAISGIITLAGVVLPWLGVAVVAAAIWWAVHLIRRGRRSRSALSRSGR